MNATIPMITALYAAILGFLGAALTINAIRHRVRSGVSTGDGKDKVRTLCGEPTDVAFAGTMGRRAYPPFGSDAYSYSGPAWVEVPVEVWTYNFGTTRLLRKLRFVGDELVEIRIDGHGY